MPLNIPSGDINNISFGPARVALREFTGASGDTPSFPTHDVGFIAEADGVQVELASEKKDIFQGNPRLVNYSFVLQQDANISFTSIQWDFDNFRFALGAGATDGSAGAAGTTATFAFGGNPLNTFVCMNIRHEMAVSGNTILMFVWKAQSMSGFTIPFQADEHSFAFQFKAVRAETDWGGTPLGTDEQLIRFNREY